MATPKQLQSNEMHDGSGGGDTGHIADIGHSADTFTHIGHPKLPSSHDQDTSTFSHHNDHQDNHHGDHHQHHHHRHGDDYVVIPIYDGAYDPPQNYGTLSRPRDARWGLDREPGFEPEYFVNACAVAVVVCFFVYVTLMVLDYTPHCGMLHGIVC